MASETEQSGALIAWIFGVEAAVFLIGLLAVTWDASRAWRKGRLREWWREVEADGNARCRVADICTSPDCVVESCKPWRSHLEEPSNLVVRRTGVGGGLIQGCFVVRERLFPPDRGCLGDPLFPPVAGQLSPPASSRRLGDALRAAS